MKAVVKIKDTIRMAETGSEDKDTINTQVSVTDHREDYIE